MKQVTVGGVQFNQPGAGSLRAAGGIGKCLDDAGDPGHTKRLRSLIAFGERHSAGSEDRRPPPISRRDGLAAVPGLIGAGLPAGMCQLNARHCALTCDERKGPEEWLNMSVGPYAKILGADAAVGGHCGGFRDYCRRSPHSAASQMNEMPLSGETVLARILAHR